MKSLMLRLCASISDVLGLAGPSALRSCVLGFRHVVLVPGGDRLVGARVPPHDSGVGLVER
jgi:hypothetical protein